MTQGVSRFSVKNLLSHSAEKSSRGSLLCCVSEKFRQPKSLWKRGGGIIKIFSRKVFFSQCRKNQQGNPSVLCFRKFLVAKFFMDKKGEYQEFPLKIFCLTTEKFRSGTLQFVINFGYRKTLCFRGLCNDFLSKIFRLTVPKKQQGKPFMLCFRSFPLAKKFIDRKEGEVSRLSLEFFFVAQCRKMPQGFPLVVQ